MPAKAASRKILIGALVAAVVLGTGSVVVLTRMASNQANAEPLKSDPVKTAAVKKGNLVDQQTSSGQLGYGTESTLAGRKGGTVTALPKQGEVVGQGKPVYWADAKPVPLFYGALPLYRDLEAGMPNGPDVKVVEENLAALGFKDFGAPDEKFNSYTASALKKWQKANGLEQNGKLGMGDVVVQPGAIRVSNVVAQLGAPASGELMKVTGTDRAVIVELDTNKQRLVKIGEKVELSVPGAKKPVIGTIVSSTKTAGGGGMGDKPKLQVSIAVDDPASVEGVDSGSVSVVFTVGKKEGVLSVPVGALLALSDGGYGVETEDRKIIPVTVGLFAKGSVEVKGEGLREGMKVVTTE